MWLLILATCFLAYSNGANDTFKGVASLYGSQTVTYRTAIWWATATTFAGSIGSMVLARSLVTRFSGQGLVPNEIVGSEYFLLAVALGAGLTVILATFAGLPVSTTHALTGAILGSGWMAAGTRVSFESLENGFLLPLLLSPILAIGLAGALYTALRFLRVRLGITKGVDTAHVISSGVVSFGRGLNDAPKLAAMLLTIQALDVRWGILVVAVAMAIGGLLNARNVAETMSHRITTMNHGQGCAANLSTGALVILASAYGLPVSTTHVSVGSLFGIGLMARRAHGRVVAAIGLAWLLTLPSAAVLGGAIYWLAAARS